MRGGCFREALDAASGRHPRAHGSNDKTVSLCDAATGELMRSLETGSAVRSVAFSILAASGRAVMLWTSTTVAVGSRPASSETPFIAFTSPPPALRHRRTFRIPAAPPGSKGPPALRIARNSSVGRVFSQRCGGEAPRRLPCLRRTMCIRNLVT
jgi:hypothetical protein